MCAIGYPFLTNNDINSKLVLCYTVAQQFITLLLYKESHYKNGPTMNTFLCLQSLNNYSH